MNNEPQNRADRREAQRNTRKDFDAVVKEVRASLDELPDNDYKMAILTALQNLEMTPHPNNLTSALLVRGCVECQQRADEQTARLLLYIAGAILDPLLCRLTFASIIHARENTVRVPPKPTG